MATAQVGIVLTSFRYFRYCRYFHFSVQHTANLLTLYQFYNTTGAQKQAAVSLLGGSTAQRTSVYVAANSYTQASDNTVIRLATYSVALNSYNAEYLSNKTQSLQRLAQQIVDQAALPHVAILGVSFDPVLDVINTLLACVSFSDSAGSCPYPNNLLNAFQLSAQAFTNIYKSLENSYLALLTSAESYKIFVTAAIRTVNQFYTSIQGAQGLVSYLSNTLGVGNICGKTNPNFCSFNPVSLLFCMLCAYFAFFLCILKIGQTSEFDTVPFLLSLIHYPFDY